jgi:hypothetical protein
MHRRQQVSRAVTVFGRASGLVSETELRGTGARLTDAGGRNDVWDTPTLPTRAVKRRTPVEPDHAARCAAPPRARRAVGR